MSNKYFDEIILITGAARSGTSMTAGVIDICGAFGGSLAPANRNNKKGMYENTQIRQTLVKPYLREHGWDALGQKPLPHMPLVQTHLTKEFVQQWRDAVEHILVSQGYKGGPVYYKGAKCCLLWPIWNAAFPKARWIIVRRNSEDIVRSCLRTSFMRAYKDKSGWLFWVSVHERRFEEMIHEGLVFAEVWPQRMINGDFTGMEAVVRNLGLEWKLDEVKEFVEPKLWSRGSGMHDISFRE